MVWTNNVGSVIEATLVIIEAGVPGAGLFVYSGTPALGNLIESVTATAGTDPFGNAYAAGYTSYDQTNFLFSQLNAGVVKFGVLSGLAGSAPDTADAGTLNGTAAGITQLTSGTAAATAFTDAAQVVLNAGKPVEATGSGLNPFIHIKDIAGTSAVDVVLFGSLIAGVVGVGAATWQTPVYGAGWAAGTMFDGFGGGQGLRYRLTAENSVWLYGLTLSSAGVTPTAFTFPAAPPKYFSTSNTTYGTVLRNRGGTITAEPVAISTGGVVFVGGGPAAGDEHLWNIVVPLEDIT